MNKHFLTTMKWCFVGLGVVLFFAGCSEDEELSPDFRAIDIVTGLNLFDANGVPIGTWGTPNDFPGVTTTFPNPSSGIVQVFSQESITRAFLVPAGCLADPGEEDITTISADLEYTLEEVLDLEVRDIDISGDGNQFALDFSGFADGFYRVFLEAESGVIYRQNLYFDPDQGNFPEFSFLDDVCQ